MGAGEFNAGGNAAMNYHPIQGGVEIFLVASCFRPLGSCADLIFVYQNMIGTGKKNAKNWERLDDLFNVRLFEIIISFPSERFSTECRITKTKVITLANHKRHR